MRLKRIAVHAVLGFLATIAMGSATAGDSNPAAAQGQQAASMQGPSGNLLWLKPSAGQAACPAGTALAVATNAAGEHVGKPKCVAKSAQPSSGDHPH